MTVDDEDDQGCCAVGRNQQKLTVHIMTRTPDMTVYRVFTYK